MNTEELLKRGIAAANSGDRETARALLAQVVLADPTSEQAWLILSDCVSDLKQRTNCLRKVLEINPSNKLALQLLQETTTQIQTLNPDETFANNQDFPKRADQRNPTSSKRDIKPPIENTGFLRSGIIGMLTSLIIVGIPAFLLVRSIEPPAFIISIAEAMVTDSDNDELALPLTPVAPGTTPPNSASIVLPTESLSTSQSPEEDFATRFKLIYGDILQAERYMENGDYTLAVLELDNITNVVPDYGHAYFLRALSHQRMNYNQRSQVDYLNNLTAAYADINMAIEIGPIRGDYYLQRANITSSFSGVEDFFLDTWAWKELGLKDTISATQLGSTNTYTNSDPGFYLVGLNRCKDALVFYSGFLEAQDPGIPTRVTIHHGLAISYQCLGDYEKALEHIDTAIGLDKAKGIPSSGISRHRREILFNLGRFSEVFEELSTFIETYPSFSGTRYYFRALLYYQMGETELALQDLEVGIRNTWVQYSFRAYVLGQIALDEGDEATALQWLQLAEASITPYHFPELHKSIQNDIESLGGEPDTSYQSWETSIQLSDIPIIPDQDSAAPTPSAYVPKTTLANYSGTGTYNIQGGDSLFFLFRPNEIAQILEAQSLTLNIEGGVFDEETTLQISYLSKDGDWEGFDTLVWGENGILNPSKYVDSRGYIIISIKNIGFDPVLILNCSIGLVAINSDGIQSVYGFR